jgi:hypothetical protein
MTNPQTPSTSLDKAFAAAGEAIGDVFVWSVLFTRRVLFLAATGALLGVFAGSAFKTFAWITQ